MWHTFTARGWILIFIIFAVTVLFVGALATVAYTPIMDYIPGYPGSKSRAQLISSLTRLDSLSKEVELWQRYTTDLRSVLEGRDISQIIDQHDSLRGKFVANVFPRSEEDSMLRSAVDNTPVNGAEQNSRSEILTFEMIAPVEGEVAIPFGVGNRLSVEITPKPNSVVLSVMDGTVIFAQWMPSDGYVVMVQHAASMISVYKNLQSTLKTVGSRVKAGEAIGVVEEITKTSTPSFEFELWSEGNAVDPESYIAFD